MRIGDRVKVIDSKHKANIGKEFLIIGFTPNGHIMVGQYEGQGIADGYFGIKQLELV